MRVAGVVGKITKFLGQVVDPRPPNIVDKSKKHKLNGIVNEDLSHKSRAEYLYYEVEVEKLAIEYPESDERMRKWVRLPVERYLFPKIYIRIKIPNCCSYHIQKLWNC